MCFSTSPPPLPPHRVHVVTSKHSCWARSVCLLYSGTLSTGSNDAFFHVGNIIRLERTRDCMSVFVLATSCNVSCAVTLLLFVGMTCVWVGCKAEDPLDNCCLHSSLHLICSGPVFVSAVLLSVVPAHTSVSRPGPS